MYLIQREPMKSRKTTWICLAKCGPSSAQITLSGDKSLKIVSAPSKAPKFPKIVFVSKTDPILNSNFQIQQVQTWLPENPLKSVSEALLQTNPFKRPPIVLVRPDRPAAFEVLPNATLPLLNTEVPYQIAVYRVSGRDMKTSNFRSKTFASSDVSKKLNVLLTWSSGITRRNNDKSCSEIWDNSQKNRCHWAEIGSHLWNYWLAGLFLAANSEKSIH